MVKYKKHSSVYILLSAIGMLLAACSPKVNTTGANKPVIRGPHFTSDSIYTAKTDSLLNWVKQQQPAVLMDSTGLITTPSEWVGSVNFGIRKANYVIIHFTAQDSVQQTIRTFTIKRTEVSAHYVVGKDGKVYHMVNDYLRSNHAGLTFLEANKYIG